MLHSSEMQKVANASGKGHSAGDVIDDAILSKHIQLMVSVAPTPQWMHCSTQFGPWSFMGTDFDSLLGSYKQCSFLSAVSKGNTGVFPSARNMQSLQSLLENLVNGNLCLSKVPSTTPFCTLQVVNMRDLTSQLVLPEQQPPRMTQLAKLHFSKSADCSQAAIQQGKGHFTGEVVSLCFVRTAWPAVMGTFIVMSCILSRYFYILWLWCLFSGLRSSWSSLTVKRKLRQVPFQAGSTKPSRGIVADTSQSKGKWIGNAIGE